MTERPNALRRGLDALYLWAGYAAGVCLIVIFALMLAMSAGRELRVNIPSGDDFAAYAMAAMAFLGMAHTFKSGEMIRVGLLIDRFSGRARWWFEVAALVLGLAFLSYFAWHAARLTRDSYTLNDMSSGVIAIPLWIPQLAMCFGVALLAVAFLDELIHVLAGNRPRYEKDAPLTAEEVVERAMASGV